MNDEDVGFISGPQFIADCVRTVYIVKNTSTAAAGSLFEEIVQKKKLLKNFQKQRFIGIYSMFKRLYELFHEVEAFFGTMRKEFLLDEKKSVRDCPNIIPVLITY